MLPGHDSASNGVVAALLRLVLALVLGISLWHTQAQARDRRILDTALPAQVALADLPPEARTTLAAIRNGGPHPYGKDGSVFGNREGLLPRQPRGYYTEYTVPTPGARNRGARRIVAGGDPRRSGEYYYTHDHYQTFLRIRE
jgi:ribonuclease T1